MEIVWLIIFLIYFIVINRFANKRVEKAKSLLMIACNGWANEIAIEQDSENWNSDKCDRGEMRINALEAQTYACRTDLDEELQEVMEVVNKVVKIAKGYRE